MPDPTRGVPRLLRTLVVSAFCLGVSALGHVAGGGSAPGLVGPALLAPACLACCAWASGRRWTFGRLLLALAVAQVGAHVVLGAFERGGGARDGAPLMAAGHAVAAVLLAALLAHAEGLLWRVADLLSTCVVVLLPGAAFGVAPSRLGARARPAAWSTTPRLRSTDLVLAAPRRGPPGAASFSLSPR